MGWSENIEIRGLVFSGTFNNAVTVWRCGTVSLSYNTFSNFKSVAVNIIDVDSSAPVVISHNSFLPGKTAVKTINTSGTVARNNYWGAPTGPASAGGTLRDACDGTVLANGSGAAIEGSVCFSPWWQDSAMATGCSADNDNDGVCGADDCDDADGSVYQMLTGYTDADGDGYGSLTGVAVCAGADLPQPYIAASGDCNDGNSLIHPAAEERCDAVDNDCDNQLDEIGCYQTTSETITLNVDNSSLTAYGDIAAALDAVRNLAGSYQQRIISVQPGSYNGFELNQAGVIVEAEPGAVIDGIGVAYDGTLKAGIYITADAAAIFGFSIKNDAAEFTSAVVVDADDVRLNFNNIYSYAAEGSSTSAYYGMTVLKGHTADGRNNWWGDSTGPASANDAIIDACIKSVADACSSAECPVPPAAQGQGTTAAGPGGLCFSPYLQEAFSGVVDMLEARDETVSFLGGEVDIAVVGSVTVTMARYDSPAPIVQADLTVTDYFDVYVPSVEQAVELQVKKCTGVTGQSVMRWFDGTTWNSCETRYENGCLLLDINGLTSPS
ncbi:MAG: hypothetical protein GY868_12290, partial [Deltaproteobacteria bacterium]|nr:hypothetical protein [Deltaproteobacteria bacterium]